MSYYLKSYSYPHNIHGTIRRTVTLAGYTENKRIHNMPSNNAIELYRGDSKMIRVFVKDENLDVVDLSNAEARFFVSYTSRSKSYLLSKSTANFRQGVIRTPERGEVVFFIDSEDTCSLDVGQYFYQVVVFLSNGSRYTVVSSFVNLHNNLEYAEYIENNEPPLKKDAIEVTIPSGSVSTKVMLLGNDVITPTLIAPDGSSEQIWITNLVYGSGYVIVYYSSAIQEDGWRLLYIISKL